MLTTFGITCYAIALPMSAVALTSSVVQWLMFVFDWAHRGTTGVFLQLCLSVSSDAFSEPSPYVSLIVSCYDTLDKLGSLYSG